MTGDGGDKRRYGVWPISQISSRWNQTARTFGDAVIAGFVGSLVLVAILALLGVALSTLQIINVNGKLPTWVALAAGGISLAVGIVAGTLLARRYYKKRLDNAQSEVARSAPHRESTKRHDNYAKHVHSVLRELSSGGLANATQSLLVAPADNIEEMTGVKVRLSIWTSKSRMLGSPIWELEHAPEHTDKQRDDFSVPLDESWIFYMAKLKNKPAEVENNSKDFAISPNDLDTEKGQGPVPQAGEID